GQVALLVPAALTCRLAAAGLAQRAGRPALAAPGAPAALPAPHVEEGLGRWRAVLSVLAARKEQLEQACGLPFRSLGHVAPAEASSVQRSAAPRGSPPGELPLRCP
ncbi:MAG: hypothetical protein KDK70_25635, partial [Myxococcales bacterium]|nr:hypothetical protein [Myxococcales bacterium]